ncbi:MAG: hypothetical protein ACREB1_06415 [Sphingomicrobium sp.]
MRDPSSKSFIEKSVIHELRGRAKLDFESGGLRATIAFPVEEAEQGLIVQCVA